MDHSVDRVLDLLGLPDPDARRWEGRLGLNSLCPNARSEVVAFQGERGAFSQEAVRRLLGDRVEVLPCQRFEEVFPEPAARSADAAVIPIENTLAGSVHENYDHLLHFDFRIVAETSVRIVHNLIAPPGVTLPQDPPSVIRTRWP